MSERITSLVGCEVCGKGYPPETMHLRSNGYLCEDCYGQYIEKWPDKPEKEKDN